MNKFEKIILTKLSNDAAINVVKSLDTSGIIYQRENFIYLKIDDNFIHKVQPYLLEYGNVVEPAYFHPPDDVGAHISVVYPEECINKQVDIGQKHTFSITGFIKAKYGFCEYFVFSVNSPSLGNFRRKYYLSSKPWFKGQEIIFHITVGVKEYIL